MEKTLEKMTKFKIPEPSIKEDDPNDKEPQKARNKRINEKHIDAYVQ